MDLSDGSTFAPATGPRKRPRSPDFGYNITSGIEPAPMEVHPTGISFEVNLKSKRPRLSGPTGDVVSSGEPKDISMRSHLMLADLPCEILQHIFTFVDPISLGRLISVNRSFRSLLDPTCPLPQRTSSSSHIAHLVMRSQDFIWATSRRTFIQGFPKPMVRMTELEMWKLVLGYSCQYCGKKATQRQSLSMAEPWNAGPGLDDVRPIWSFRVRSCGRCLQPRLIKDTELAFSAQSALRPGLPFAFLTGNLNYIPSSVIHQKAPPPHLELIKYYFRPQLEDLQSRFYNVEAMGAATLGEWYKGLEASGQQIIADATRFEQWELQNGFFRIPMILGQSDATVLATSGIVAHQGNPVRPIDYMQQTFPRSAAGTPSSGYLRLELSTTGSISDESQYTAGQASNKFLPTLSTATGAFPRHEPLDQTLMRPPRQKIERSLKEAKEARAERRKEIERRCLALDSPIMPSTLTYMDAFQAAILISLPLDDKAWEILKPRLLSQRTDAENKETQATLSNPSVQHAKRQQFEEEQRVAQENTSHMWLELKVPSREKLRKYALDFIHQTWSDGQAVTRATASKFAAEVLCHMRQRFDEVIAQEDRMLALKGTAFPQDPESLACRKLRLEDMKWVFEEFVKPHTERFGKELFLCHVCDTNQKLFSFEAIIQHFAAKHTNSLSHGSSTVYWKADWPIEPPFDPHPNIPWAIGGITSAPKVKTHQQAHAQFSARGIPPSDERASRNINTVAGHFLPPQRPTNPPQYTGQKSHQTSLGHDSRYLEHFPPGLSTSTGPGIFTRSSIARSEASGNAMEDEYDLHHAAAALRRGLQGPPLRRDSFTGSGHGSQTLQHHLSRDAVRWDECPQALENGRGWEAWERKQPVPHGSMIYSYEDGTSRFSYGVSLPRAVGVRSETGRESRATSRISLHRKIGSEPGASLDEPETSRSGIDQITTKTAVENFLNNFDPQVGEDALGASRAIADPARSTDLQQALGTGVPQRARDHVGQHETWGSMSSPHTDHPHPFSPRYRTSLPIREIERHTSLAADPATHPHYSSSLPSDHGYEVTRGLISGHTYVRGSPERSHRIRYGSESEDLHDFASAYAEPLYERRYFSDRDGRRYEEIREMGMERYPFRHDGFSDRPREVFASSGLHSADDGRYFLEQPVGREDYARGVPRAYPINEAEHDPQQIRGLSFEHKDSYHGEGPLVLDHRTRTLRFDNRDVMYQPVERPMRSTARSLGMSHPKV